MAYTVYPSANNVGGGRVIREKYMTALYKSIIYPGCGFVDTGFSLLNSGGLNVYLTAGTAVVDGYLITSDANWLIPNLTASGTFYVALEITYDSSGYASAAILNPYTTKPVALPHGIAMYKITMSGGNLYMLQNFRPTLNAFVTQPVW